MPVVLARANISDNPSYKFYTDGLESDGGTRTDAAGDYSVERW